MLQILWSSAAVEAYGNEKGHLAGLKVKNLKSGDITDVEVLWSSCCICRP